MEKESRLQLGCALLTCLTLPLMLCAAAIVSGLVVVPNPSTSSAPAPPSVNRLALVGSDGNVYLVGRNGESKVALTNDAALSQSTPVRRLYAFPNWSPDSQQVAFVGLSSERAGKAFLYAASAKDGKLTEIYSSDQAYPFYLYWSPDSKRVAFLAEADNALGLYYANADGSGKQELGKGNPFYFSWSPDSQSLLSHVGGSRRQSADSFIGLHSLTPLGQPEHLAIAPANFLAPAWSPDGKEMLSALMGVNNTSDTLIVANRQGEQLRTLAKFSGNISFSWSSDGKQIAYMTAQRAAVGLQTELHLIKANGEADQLLTDDSPIAFFWSPDNQKIAYLVRVRGGQGSLQPVGDNRQQSQLRFTWRVVTLANKNVVTLSTFVPTDEFASLLPYFDQYAQSLRLWSSDGKSLVYGAYEPDGTESIYVADVNGGQQGRRIAEGNIAVWSYR